MRGTRKRITLKEIKFQEYLRQLRGLPDPQIEIDRAEAMARSDYRTFQEARFTMEDANNYVAFSERFVIAYLRRYTLESKGRH